MGGTRFADDRRWNEPVVWSDDVQPPTSRLKLTCEDFLLFLDDGKRHELIDGEHYLTPSPNPRHQAILGSLYLAIATFLEAHPIGRVYLSPLDVVLSDIDVVEPDLLFLSVERSKEALTLYERAGVSEYWFVDPELETVRIYRLEGDAFARPLELSRERDEILTTALLPGLDLSLVRIFRD